jgi:predicted alpha/beta superfamily hydrolase
MFAMHARQMPGGRLIGAGLAALVMLARPLGAHAQAMSVADVVPAHDSFTVTSRVLGEERWINVHVPAAYRGSPAERFPVLYMPDGGIDEDFPHVVNTVDSLLARSEVRPFIIVGIPNTQRRRDLTGPTRIKSDSAIAPRVGGSAAFRRFIREELIPAIDARYRTTPERAIVGESLAGLFVVETLLLEPSLFDHYVAFDPSLWWNGGALVDAAGRSLTRLGAARRTLYLTSSSQDIDAQTTRLAGVLRASAPRSLTWIHTPRPDLMHATIFRGEAPVALGFALATTVR